MRLTIAELAALPYRDAVDTFTQIWIQLALERHGNNRCSVAESAGIHRNTVSRIMRRSNVHVIGKRTQRKLKEIAQ